MLLQSHHTATRFEIMGIAITMLYAIFCTFPSYSQDLEVDHLWIRIQSDSKTIQIIEEAGLRFSNSMQGNPKMIHKGQGTAGLYVRFNNIYLEFIWIEDEALLRQVAPELGSTLIGYPNTSPIGIGLRYSGNELVDIPFPTTSYWAEWMRPLDALAVAKRNVSTDPAIFVIPKWLNWKERTLSNPEILNDAKHPLGIDTITKIRLYGPNHPSKSEAVQFLLSHDLVDFQNSESYLLELEFDHEAQQKLDLRPELPLVLKY